LRLYDDQHTSIHHGVINEQELRLQPVLKAATGIVYINDILPDAGGTVLIGFGDDPGLFWYRDGKLQQYQKVQFYSISPQQKNMILFYDSNRRQPLLISRPIWSPNGQYLLGNMVKSIKGALLEGEPYIINLNTAELSKISNENNGIRRSIYPKSSKII